MSKKTLRLLVFSAGLVWLCGWAAPAQALYAPAQNLLYAGIDPVYSNVVTYQVMDPFNPWVPAADSWTLDPSFCSDWGIDPPVVDGGIVAWVSKKMTTGETEYAYTVHYRIYDPGRGRWVGGEHELNTGAARQIYNLIVKDGVVAWKAGYRSSPSPTADKTYLVTCVTYNPIDGVWPENTYTLPVPYDSPRAPEVLSVQNGVVAWPNLPFDDNIDIHFRIYDPEIKGWVWGEDVNDWFDMEWVKIENATVHLRVGKPGLPGGYDYYRGYNIDTHQWMEDSTTTPRASFVAQPVSGFAPVKVCFWDRSIAVNGADWSWNFGDGGTSSSRSPVHIFYTAGDYPVTLTLPNYEIPPYQQTVQVKPVPTFTGSISINGGETYSNSTNVTVYLWFSNPDGAQYRFRNYAYPHEGEEWYPWFPYTEITDWVVSKEGEWFATVQFMDKDGFLSPEYTDSIILDFTPPIGGVMLNDGAATTTNPKVKATYLAFDLITAVNQMCYTAFNEEDPYSWWSLYEPYQGAQMDKFLTFSPKPGKKTVIMHFMDAAGNVTEKTATITLKARALPFLNLLLD